MSSFARILLLSTLLLALPGIGSGSLFAPSAELWERWTAHDPASGARVDHAAWDGLLAQYLEPHASGANRFDYGGLATSRTERAQLSAYLARLSATPVSSLNRDEQMAFWINLYNALTVMVVADHYPVASIRDIDISPGLFSTGPWDAELIEVEGEALTLNDIEHRILRPIWRDPRVHYAVNCASVGCPDLKPSAWAADTMDADLDAAARAYVNDPRGVGIDGDRIVVSSIYDWFVDDFGGSETTVLAHLKAHAEPPLAAELGRIGRIDDTGYDWRLNNLR